mmetsp:Transcript_4694/g.6330  ORF Transcript_4694/g.6330 Transcript_4694/m.6330 type:complete len:406 (+) Transcript_4694:224-1441(+)
MSWTYGIVLNLIGSVLINGGTNLMKLGHMQFSKDRCDENKEEDEIRQEGSKSFRNRISPRDRSEGDNCSVITRESSSSSSTSDYKRNLSGKAADKEKDENPSSAKKGKVWYAGSFFFVFGNVVNFISFSFAAQSLLAAIGSAQFISNVFFGAIVLGEKVTKRTIVATLAILCGNAMVVYCFSRADDSNKPSGEKKQIVSENEVFTNFDKNYSYFLLAMFLLFLVCRNIYVRVSQKIGKGESVRHSNRILPTMFAAYSAILGSQSVLLAKCLSILLRAAVDTPDLDEEDRGSGDLSGQTKIYFIQLIVMAWFITIIFWLKQMNRALKEFDGLVIIPTLQVFWTFFSIISGGVFFKEFLYFDTMQVFGFVFGIIIVFVGVIMLSSTSSSKTQVRPSVNAEMVQIDSV